jgi:aldehyde:ferredoxin oxidoreductase
MKIIADKISGGIAGKILRVDLTSGTISTEDTEKYAKRFIGGRAVNSFILFNETDPKTKWSDPENLLIFGAGVLEGTIAPGACRVSIDTINVFSNGKGSANCGGNFGPELKYAGFDHVVITGKAKNPVYLWIHDGSAELRDASSIWGKTTFETEEILQEELGDDAIEVASIGLAGENLVRGAMIIVDCSKVAGGSGVGCVMGDKKLKALAVRGHGSIKVAQPERFMQAVDVALKKIRESPFTPIWRTGIIEGMYLPEHTDAWNAWTTVRGGQDDYWPMEKREELTGLARGVPKYKKNTVACFSCPVGCMPFYEVPSGKYKSKGIGYWINGAWYSERFDVSNPEASLKFQNSLARYGMDGDNASVVLSWAFECYEKGLITKEETNGLELKWGDADAMIEMLRRLVYREGIGDFLADGVKIASEKLGKGSEKLATHMKGQDTLDPYRIAKGWGLGLVTSPVAGRHLRGSVGGGKFFGPKGVDFPVDKYEDQPEMVFWQLQAKETEDMTGICSYMSSYCMPYALEPSDIAALTSSAMGIDLTADELMLVGRRSYNLEKAFNTIRTNLDRKDDLPPKRYIEESVKSGPYKGWKADEDKYNEMLDKFYELHGWDKKTGLQTRQCLVDLGLEDVAEALKRNNKLIE